MPLTNLKDFQTVLESLEATQLMDILVACQNKYSTLSPTELNSATCMTKTNISTNSFKDVNDKIYTFASLYNSPEIHPAGTLYSYSTIQARAYADANTSAGVTYADYLSDLTQIHSSIADVPTSRFISDHATTTNLYTQMKSNRNDLDNKMRRLYKDGYTDNQIQNENVVLVNLTWTVLATCVLYFLFVKL
jgi:hypothetical protein